MYGLRALEVPTIEVYEVIPHESGCEGSAGSAVLDLEVRRWL